jgi:hypothetical protein
MYSMTAPATWPSGKNEKIAAYDREQADGPAPGPLPPDHEPAHLVIGEMADLLRDTRSAVVTDAGVLGAVAVGLAVESGLAVRALRPTLVGAIDLSLLGGIVLCWVVAVFLLVRASRPVINALSELRWVTGAPVDPRPGWVTLPPTGADPEEWSWNRAYLLLGAARRARLRIQFADTWTYFTGGCFLVWTMLIILGR